MVVACESCIKSYGLPENTKGREGMVCYWCLKEIFDDERLSNEIVVTTDKILSLTK